MQRIADSDFAPAATTGSSQRLLGLDLARFIAFAGMVFVNFRIVMGAEGGGGVLGLLTGAIEGRAAATFVVLAGIGVGLFADRSDHNLTVAVTLKRSVFLLAIGLLNSLVFDADILHYYAFYFLLGIFFLRASSRVLIAGMIIVNVAFVLMVLFLDYEKSWNWNDYSYADFWTPAGFTRNLFFNGWHPVIPWFGFLLFGFLLSRISLSSTATQNRLILFGGSAIIAAELARYLLTPLLQAIHPELGVFATTKPVPPMPLYSIAGIGSAALVIGVCLRVTNRLHRNGVLQIFAPAGRQTLTLYIAHILIGMGTLDAMEMLGNQTVLRSFVAATIFCLITIVYAMAWSRYFKHGPVEMAMRKIAA